MSSNLITKNLFDNVLINPIKKADSLYIVSGYATAAMAFHHLNQLDSKPINIKLIVGMCSLSGVSESDHRGFVELMSKSKKHKFECSYLIKPPAMHSKLYTWCKEDSPILAFTGSANYTQRAFGKKQREILSDCDPASSLNYFNSIIGDTIYCDHQDALSFVDIYKSIKRAENKRVKEILNVLDAEIEENEDYFGLEKTTVSLLDKTGKEVPTRSGLNWGQRPGREPNQAYLSLKGDIKKTNYFPGRGIHFTVLTDDGKVLICTRAQDDLKAIETPHNNSLIGEYFRNRLGLPNGAFINKDHLEKYGRTDVDFYKIDEETYRMDFSV